MARHVVGSSVELTYRPKKANGDPPDLNQITRAVLRVWWNGVEQAPAFLTYTPPNTYVGTVRFTEEGQWSVRFETDGLETADERYYTIQPSVFSSPL